MNSSFYSDSGLTPIPILNLVRRVFDVIDLDPTSSSSANARVGAARFFDEGQNGLIREWSGNVYCNPPGGKSESRESKTKLFWQKLMYERKCDRIKQAIFLFFSLDGLQTTQSIIPSACDFPIVIPAKRIRFDYHSTKISKQAYHANAIVYVAGTIDNKEEFIKVFSEIGKVMMPCDRDKINPKEAILSLLEELE